MLVVYLIKLPLVDKIGSSIAGLRKLIRMFWTSEYKKREPRRIDFWEYRMVGAIPLLIIGDNWGTRLTTRGAFLGRLYLPAYRASRGSKQGGELWHLSPQSPHLSFSPALPIFVSVIVRGLIKITKKMSPNPLPEEKKLCDPSKQRKTPTSLRPHLGHHSSSSMWANVWDVFRHTTSWGCRGHRVGMDISRVRIGCGGNSGGVGQPGWGGDFSSNARPAAYISRPCLV